MTLHNTQQYCLVFMKTCGVGQIVTPLDIVAGRWPESKQPEKKVITITKHLRVLIRLGYCSEVGPDHYVLTRAGLRAYNALFDEDEKASWLKTNPKPLLKIHR